MQRLFGKTAVITGGSSGIGLATARLFAEHGARLVLFGRDEARLLTAQAGISGASVLCGDVARQDDLSRLADFAATQLGRVDVLFVNAGLPGLSAAGAPSRANHSHQREEATLHGDGHLAGQG